MLNGMRLYDLVIIQQTIIKIGRAHVRTPVTRCYLVCRLLLEKKKKEDAYEQIEKEAKEDAYCLAKCQYIPHVIEPSAGVDRLILLFIFIPYYPEYTQHGTRFPYSTLFR